jgi:Flp pilus assembly protein TadG
VAIDVVSGVFEGSHAGPRVRLDDFRHKSPRDTVVMVTIAAPVFVLLAFVIAQTTLTFIAERVMEAAVTATVRQIQTDPIRAAQLTQAEVRGAFCGRLPIFMDCGSQRLRLDIRSYGSIAGINPGRPPNGTEPNNAETPYNLGNLGDFVFIRAYYRWNRWPIYRLLFSRQSPSPASYVSAFAVFKKGV